MSELLSSVTFSTPPPPHPQPSKTLTNVQIENQKWLFVSPLSLIFVGEI